MKDAIISALFRNGMNLTSVGINYIQDGHGIKALMMQRPPEITSFMINQTTQESFTEGFKEFVWPPNAL